MPTTTVPTAEQVVEDPFDLDVTIVLEPVPDRPRQTWNSGSNCHTDDSCGHTCESACSPSCTDGDEG